MDAVLQRDTVYLETNNSGVFCGAFNTRNNLFAFVPQRHTSSTVQEKRQRRATLPLSAQKVQERSWTNFPSLAGSKL